jgi:hypothetical protein
MTARPVGLPGDRSGQGQPARVGAGHEIRRSLLYRFLGYFGATSRLARRRAPALPSLGAFRAPGYAADGLSCRYCRYLRNQPVETRRASWVDALRQPLFGMVKVSKLMMLPLPALPRMHAVAEQ